MLIIYHKQCFSILIFGCDIISSKDYKNSLNTFLTEIQSIMIVLNHITTKVGQKVFGIVVVRRQNGLYKIKFIKFFLISNFIDFI